MSALVAQKLQVARDVVARPGGWGQGASNWNAKGESYVPVEEAVCFCLRGALDYAFLQNEPCETALLRDMLRATTRAIGVVDIPKWNDTPGRTQAEVVAALDRAIVFERSRP